MKVAEAHILFVPDRGEPTPGHWQWRWRQKLSTGRFVAPQAGHAPERERIEAVVEAVNAADRPVVLVGHGHGAFAAVAALPDLTRRVAGGFFAAPPDIGTETAPVASPHGWPAHIRARLPFPAMLVGSRNDPAGSYEAAERLAADWGAMLLDAGEAGHIDEEAGYGPWPEGSMAFAQFLRKLV